MDKRVEAYMDALDSFYKESKTKVECTCGWKMSHDENCALVRHFNAFRKTRDTQR